MRVLTLTVDKVGESRFRTHEQSDGEITRGDYLLALIALYKQIMADGITTFGETEFLTALIIEM